MRRLKPVHPPHKPWMPGAFLAKHRFFRRLPPFRAAAELNLKEYAVSSAKLPDAFDGLRIAYASDIHYGVLLDETRVRDLAERLNALDPDVVLLGGDYGEDTSQALAFWKIVPELHAKLAVCAVLGNHDRAEGPAEPFCTAMKERGVTPLINSALTLTRNGRTLALCSTDDFNHGTPDFAGVAAQVRNSDFVEPFEAVTNLYSRPDPSGIDGTPYMTPFYILLFGMMLSDTGYGLLLLIGGYLFLKLKKPGGMMGSFAKVITWGGLSTVIWGFLTGTFFGLDFDVIFGTTDVFPILVDPMSDPIMMLILCFGLGVLHILFGVSLKIKMSFDAGDWQTAVFDNLSWILIIIGLIMFAGASAVQGLPPVVSKIGLVLAVIGAVMILLFKGREKKNVVSRTVSGLGELYQVTSYLSDILSYARLFALGIATGVIASVFNQLCGMLMGSPNIILKILGTLIACVLLVGLHLFNLAINTLGAFVHCARLQYVEFYGKFYEAGGRTFQPLGYTAKHVRLTDK